jgi:hypothetical protein
MPPRPSSLSRIHEPSRAPIISAARFPLSAIRYPLFAHALSYLADSGQRIADSGFATIGTKGVWAVDFLSCPINSIDSFGGLFTLE